MTHCNADHAAFESTDNVCHAVRFAVFKSEPFEHILRYAAKRNFSVKICSYIVDNCLFQKQLLHRSNVEELSVYIRRVKAERNKLRRRKVSLRANIRKFETARIKRYCGIQIFRGLRVYRRSGLFEKHKKHFARTACVGANNGLFCIMRIRIVMVYAIIEIMRFIFIFCTEQFFGSHIYADFYSRLKCGFKRNYSVGDKTQSARNDVRAGKTNSFSRIFQNSFECQRRAYRVAVRRTVHIDTNSVL